MTLTFIAADPAHGRTVGIDIRYAYAISGLADHFFIYASLRDVPLQTETYINQRYTDYLFAGVVDSLKKYYKEHQALPETFSPTFQKSDFDSLAVAPLNWKGYRLELAEQGNPS